MNKVTSAEKRRARRPCRLRMSSLDNGNYKSLCLYVNTVYIVAGPVSVGDLFRRVAFKAHAPS